MTPFRPLLRNSGAVLLEAVEERARQGWRLITSFCFSGGTRYLVWARNVYADPARIESGPYRILPVPTFVERLRSSGHWQRTLAERLARLEPGWSIAAFCPFLGFLLRYTAAPAGAPSDRGEYSILCRTPVWWRTVFGSSWLKVLSGELNRLPQPETEIISYLGRDHFLTRTHRAWDEAEPDGSRAVPFLPVDDVAELEAHDSSGQAEYHSLADRSGGAGVDTSRPIRRNGLPVRGPGEPCCAAGRFPCQDHLQ